MHLLCKQHTQENLEKTAKHQHEKGKREETGGGEERRVLLLLLFFYEEVAVSLLSLFAIVFSVREPTQRAS